MSQNCRDGGVGLGYLQSALVKGLGNGIYLQL